jgi:beta-aspartyl-dipeptidase (metallo-type)
LFTLIKNVELYCPNRLGVGDILMAGGKIVWVGNSFPGRDLPNMDVIDGTGKIAVPGFVDGHVHIAGGGGEGGFSSRTPEAALSDLTEAGVTSVIGVLGTDSTCRYPGELLAKARSLREEGISAWALTGSYEIPVKTLMGSVKDDLILIDLFVGVGEVAISDHRSSQPTFEELSKLAASAHVGGMIGGKSGVINVHMGDGPALLSPIRKVVETTELGLGQFLPTHVNRNPDLFEDAIEYGLSGGQVDLTTSTTPQFLEEGEIKCSQGLKRLLDSGVPAERISFSSDGQGSLPFFDSDGAFTGLSIGTSRSLLPEVRDSVLQEGIPLETAVQVITSTPASTYRLPGKGRIAEGNDGDVVLLNRDDLSVDSVFAMGRKMVQAGKAVVKGKFER